MSIGKQTWVMTTLDIGWRKDATWSDIYSRGMFMPVKTASEIHYWGHYPVADMEFVTDAPVSVGMRAWSPFIPGDTAISNTPGAVFEVHLRNRSDETKKGSVAFSFPGPSEGEAGTVYFRRKRTKGRVNGVRVRSKQASYMLGAIQEDNVRVGGSLEVDGEAWATMEHYLPHADAGAGSTVAVDFELEAGEERIVRFVLGWYAPKWMGGGTMTAGGNGYRHMYAKRYSSERAVATMLARRHEKTLRRILSWQEAIYTDENTPAWLSDALVNVLYLITETSVWAQAKKPIGKWCKSDDGVFSLNESPRWCPQMDCIPCTFYGNLPFVYFFPDTMVSNLRTYKAYQYPTGQAPWVFGGCTTGTRPYEVALPSPGYKEKPQTTLDGSCYVDMVDRMWMRTGDDAILDEFYKSVKKNTIFTMNLRPDSGAAGVVSMPEDNFGQDWFESCELFGIVPHIGGAHLAQLRMAKRMAEAKGDSKFARRCSEWLEEGSAVMEDNAWIDTHYMLFNELETGKRSDLVMSYVFDGEWMALSHGLPGVFQAERVETMLKTIEDTALAVSGFGASTFAAPSGDFDTSEWSPGYWGTKGVHPPGTFMLAMTYMYKGQLDTGMGLAERTVGEILKRGWYWDWPVCIDGEGHERIGADYYQNLMLWAVPAAAAGQDITGPCGEGGLVEKVIAAGAK